MAGKIINYSELASTLGISLPTVKNYCWYSGFCLSEPGISDTSWKAAMERLADSFLADKVKNRMGSGSGCRNRNREL